MSLFSGLAAFPITPADADGRVDVAGVRLLARRLADARVDSIGPAGQHRDLRLPVAVPSGAGRSRRRWMKRAAWFR
ncbi:MAG: hypothetical protein WDM85_19015 [Caulobacteraceae bacterium]